MNTKLVTAYYPLNEGTPFWGKQNRHRWYKNSIASICNVGVPVICYTDDNGYDEILETKISRNLDNLIIKKYEMTSSPFFERMLKIRTEGNPELYNNKSHPFYKMPFVIYWNKWVFLEMEYEPDTYIYWIDGGLSTDGVLPHRVNDYVHEPDFSTRYAGIGNYYNEHEFKFHSYNKVFNPEFINKINQFSEGKIINLCRRDTTDNDFYLLEEKLNLTKGKIMRDNLYPVGALFGGNTPYLLDYINEFYNVSNKILAIGDYACTEQEIMGHIHAEYREWFKDWMFHDFYHDDWKINNDQKLVPYRELFPNNISFSDFFINPLDTL
jgi:hypothetical protein